jgi:hypothetical protein
MPPVLPAFYVLRPSKTLLEWLAERDVPTWLELDRPRIWSQDEIPPDHDYVGQGEDAQTLVKLAVLASFQRHAERASLEAPDASGAVTERVLRELLGPPPLTVERFDRWWFLERAAEHSSVESTLAHTPVRTLREVRGPAELSPTVKAHLSSHPDADPRPVGEGWERLVHEREQHTPQLQCAVRWVLERLAEKTPHRTCALRVKPFSLDEPVEALLQVPGWTVHERGTRLREGVRLTLDELTRSDDTWTFSYQVLAGGPRAALSGTAWLKLQEAEQGWAVHSGALRDGTQPA